MRCTVVEPFIDVDGDLHAIGEEWTFLGYAIAPYDDGLSLFVSLDPADEWHIRLSMSTGARQNITDTLEELVKPVKA